MKKHVISNVYGMAMFYCCIGCVVFLLWFADIVIVNAHHGSHSEKHENYDKSFRNCHCDRLRFVLISAKVLPHCLT